MTEAISSDDSCELELMQDSSESVSTSITDKAKQVFSGMKTPAEMVIGGALLSPLNEAARFGALGGVLALTGDPYLGAATFGASTAAIESTAAIITADLLTKERARRYMDKLNEWLGKIGVTEATKLNSVTKAGISYAAGSGIAVVVEHRENPARTKSQNRRYGLKNASALSAVCTVQGFLISEGLANPDPLSAGGAIVAVGSMIGIGKWAKSRIKKSSEE